MSYIIKKLNLPYWDNPLYTKLLTPSIWIISLTRIEEGIKIAENLGLERYITLSFMRKSPTQIEAIYKYLKKHNIGIIINSKLNPIFNISPSFLRKEYGIDLKELVKEEKSIISGYVYIKK